MAERDLLELLLHEIKGIKTNLSGLKDDFTEIKSDISGLKSNVSGLTNDVSDIRSDISGLKTDISGLKTESSGLHQELKDFRAEANAKLDNLQNQSDVIAHHVLMHTGNLEEIRETQKSINEIIGEHEIAIRTMRRRPV